jgi:hypothetical protein
MLTPSLSKKANLAFINAETAQSRPVQFEFRCGDHRDKGDFAPQNRPMLFTTLKLRNIGTQPIFEQPSCC